MRVGLVTDVPQDLVAGGVEQRVQGDRDLTGPEVGADVAADELSRHVRERLAAFNVPSRYWFRGEALPRNPAGKILKRELRTELLGDAPAI